MATLGWNNRPWTLPDAGCDKKPFYISVGGNTGSGKSTLVRAISNLLDPKISHIYIDERETHHPFLDRLFHDPRRYSFEIQLNFMIQRCILVKRWLDAGVSLIMERSHLEDVIFIRMLHEQKMVSDEQYMVYMSLWESLDSRTPKPDIFVLFDIPPEESIRRLGVAESLGERPCEFRDEEHKQAWVQKWGREYQRRIAELRNIEEISKIMYVVSSDKSPDNLALEIINRLQ